MKFWGLKWLCPKLSGLYQLFQVTAAKSLISKYTIVLFAYCTESITVLTMLQQAWHSSTTSIFATLSVKPHSLMTQPSDAIKINGKSIESVWSVCFFCSHSVWLERGQGNHDDFSASSKIAVLNIKMSWLVHWVFYAFVWISRQVLAAWPCTSVSFTFLTLLTVKTGFEPVIAWIVKLLTLLNGRLSLLSPRNRREYFSSSLLGSFLMQAFWSCARKQNISPLPTRNALVARDR